MSNKTDNRHLLTYLAEHAQNHPLQPALSWKDAKTISYGELWQRIISIASNLQQMGVTCGDIGMVLLDGSADSITTHFALSHLGAITIPLDPELPIDLLAARLQQFKPKLLLAPLIRQEEVASKNNRPQILLFSGELEHLLNHPPSNFPGKPVASDTPTLLMQTTGTTGTPKNVVLTLDNITAASEQINRFMGLTADDSEVLTLPLYHSFGLGRLRSVLLAGAFAHIRTGRFRPEILLKTVRDEQATVFAQVPAGIQLLLAFGKRITAYLTSVRLLEIGSATLAGADKQKLLDYLPNSRICHHYGLTEASRSLFLDYGSAKAANSLESMGKATPGVELKIITPDGKTGTEGELAVGGRHVSPGYYQDGKIITATKPDGFFPTGDLVRLDRQGFYHYLGRQDDLINIGGFKINPQEVENLLKSQWDAVIDAAIIGVESEGNIAVTACIVWDENSEKPFVEREVRARLKTRLETYKIPSSFILLKKLPRSCSGKLLRKQLQIEISE